jgi:RHS repeat-associated protein/uncharacterized repeat protein (TIGR01451 family)
LTSLEASSLTANASVTASGPTGPVSANAPPVATVLHLPIVTITKSGPPTVTAGTTATYPLTLKNAGGATASGIAIADTVPGGPNGTVSGIPSTLAVGASSTGVQATFAVPPTQSQGNLTDTATVNWLDANGNAYGPVSSSFTTFVQNQLLGARLTLALSPGSAGLNPVNGNQALQITLANSAGVPIAGQAVTVNVTGANPTSLSSVTDANGLATVTYTGTSAGIDQAQATATSATITIQSNTVSVTWIQPIQPISTTPVQGNFYAESVTQPFVAKPGDPAAFQQTFPTINFNPPANTVPHNVSGVGPTTRPFTDVTTDAVGNFAGTIIAQGNGVQAGVGTLTNFNAVLTANFIVSQPQDVTFNIIADDGFILGVGGGATRVSGTLQNPPASGLTAFNGYPVLGAYNVGGGTAPGTYTVTIHFPSAGAVPYELDYFECCGSQLSLTMTVVSVNTGPYNLSTGYADTVRPAGTSSFPFPWNGAANTTFVGSGSPYDTGGLRFDNNTNQPITLNHVTVDIGTRHYDPWNLNLNVPANGTLILAGATGAGAFNTSEANGALKSGGGGGSSGFIATQWATGFATCCGGIGPVGVAFDNAGNLFVMNYATGFLYKFGPGGGISGPATQVNANSIQGCPAGLAFSKDGKHLYLAMQCLGTVLEIDQVSGVVLRTVASGISAPTGIATDPLSGDLFVSQPNGTPTIQRIQNPLSASPTVTVYSSPGTTDGIAFGPDGSLYGSVAGQQVVIIAGTNTASPGTVLTRIQSGELASTDGIALLPPPPGAVGTSIVVNKNNGVLVQIDNPQTANPTFHNIVTGGSRGDFATVGPDGCLYATQTSSVIKVTASDGSCPFIPSICLPNPVIPQVHVTINGFTFNYNDPGQALNSGGIDGECNGTNESQAWQQIGGKGGPVNIPLPPAMTLALQAAPSNGHIVGQSQAFTVAAMDGAGRSVPNVAVQLGVFGANPQQLSGTTDVNGTATFSYIGSNAGTDTVTATAFISGLRTVSNAVQIQWTIPAPGAPVGGTSGPAPPSVVVTSPADGSAVSQPIPITATIGAPPSSSINFWSAQYQNVAPGSAVITLASGTTKPPATLATFDPATLAAGTYAITVTATTLAGGGATAVVRVIVGNGGGTAAQAPPTISAPSPADGTIVTKPVPVTATIAPPSGQTIASWKVTYQALDVEPIVTLASGTGTPPSPLTTFDPTLLPNDTYAITIAATASGGGIQTLTTTVAVFGNLKLGRYVTTYLDMSVPVGSFQMQVRRVYDSIDKRVGDFGIGWHVELANFRVSANRQLGAGGWTEYPTSCIFGLCFYGFKTSAPHYVTVTFPDQHQEIFDFTPQGGAGILYWQGNAAFTARAGTGTTSTLEVAGDSSLSYDFAGNLVGASAYFNPTRFKLTTHDGRILILDTVLSLVSETDRNGNSLTIDGAGVHATNGQSITYTRDSLNRITQINGPVGSQVLHYAYSASGDLDTVVDAVGNQTTFTYGANHNLLSANGPGGRPLHTLAYDAAGRLATITDGNGNPVQIHSDAGTQQQVITSASGRLNTVDFLDDVGDVVREDQVFGGATQTTRWTYDANGNVLTKRDPLGNSWSAQYDDKGNLVQYTNAAQQQTNYTYDSFGQLTSVRGPGGRLLEAITYDASGNTVQIQNGDQPGSTYAYDGSSRLTKVTDPAGRSTQLAYDANGNLTTATANSGQSWSFQIDASGRLLSRTDPLGATTSFTYDGNGQLTSIKDAANTIVRTYAYDSNGDVTSETDALGTQVTYSYDAGFRQTGISDRAGRHITYAYDADGNLTSEALPGADMTTYTYDPLNRLVDALNANAEVSLAYDAAGRLVSQTTRGTASSPQPTVALAYSYDAEGRLVTLSGPEGQTNYAYDPLSRLTSVTDPARGVFNFGYDGNQRLTSLTRPNGVNDSAVYDASDFLTQLTSSLNANPIAQVVYASDPNGQRQSQTDLVGKHSFTRDPTGQLTNTIHPTGGLAAESYRYDSRGNRTATATATPGSIVYDSRDRLVSDPTASYTYDAEGNLVSRLDTGSGRTTTYDWNANHQLLAVHFSDSTLATYRYDPFGRRIEVNDRGTITRYAYDAENLHLEYDATNTLAAVYTNGIDINSVLEMTRGGQSYYYLKDGLGSTTALVNGAGTVSTSYTYDSFGRQTSAGNVPNPITYAGGQFDASSGLYYFRARYYDPVAGRFISEDPVESPNPYIYARNDPADFADPLGEQAAPEYGLLQSFKARVYAVFATIGRLLTRIYRCIGEMIQVAASLAGIYSGNDTGGNRMPPNRIDSPPTQRGNAPTGDDGNPVELHHRGQQPGSPLDEMTQTDHRIGDNYAKNHPNTGQENSKIDRGKWGNQQKNYWKNEWDRGRWARGCR